MVISAVISELTLAGTRHVVYLDTSLPTQRFRKMKTVTELQEQQPDSSDVYVQGKIEYYTARPENPLFDSMKYPGFATKYDTVKKETPHC
jgi:hypothetical protein